MGLWGRIFAGGYDRMMARSERDGLGAHRRKLLSAAGGEVLEIGGGTGANLALYGAQVSSLTVTEPEQPMVERLRARIERERPGTSVVSAPAENLPFKDDSFDVAVSTLVLCTVETSRAH